MAIRYGSGDKTREIIAFTNPKSPVVEAYHNIRTNIMFTSLDNPVKSLLVTSPLPGNGKTTTVTNLGVTIARTGASVLLVDADLRKPTLHKLFNQDNDRGLTSLLVDKSCNQEDVIRETNVENLSMLSSGPVPPNPSELLVSKVFVNTLDKLKESYDYVMVDSPPVVSVTDPALLSRHVDGTILVIDFGTVPKELAQKAKDQLTNVNANILGVVLNKIPSNGYGYYYYYYQEYYGPREEKKGLLSRIRKKRKK